MMAAAIFIGLALIAAAIALGSILIADALNGGDR